MLATIRWNERPNLGSPPFSPAICLLPPTLGGIPQVGKPYTKERSKVKFSRNFRFRKWISQKYAGDSELKLASRCYPYTSEQNDVLVSKCWSNICDHPEGKNVKLTGKKRQMQSGSMAPIDTGNCEEALKAGLHKNWATFLVSGPQELPVPARHGYDSIFFYSIQPSLRKSWFNSTNDSQWFYKNDSNQITTQSRFLKFDSNRLTTKKASRIFWFRSARDSEKSRILIQIDSWLKKTIWNIDSNQVITQ